MHSRRHRNMMTLVKPRLNGRLLLFRLAASLLLAYAVIVAMLLFFEDRFVFHPTTAAERWSEPPADCQFEDLNLVTAKGDKTHARWFPCPNAKGAMLYTS